MSQRKNKKEETKESGPVSNPEQDKKEEKGLTPEEEDKHDLYVLMIFLVMLE